MSDRVQQVCDMCGGVDTDPRHVSQTGSAPVSVAVLRKALDGGADDRLLADLNDTTTTIHHLDCGAAAACDTCTASEARTGGKRGAALDKALTALNKES